MDRRRAAGALLALAACIACSSAAPTASNQTALELLDSPTEGCYYNFQHYGEGDRIMTNEPCLNCTCHNRMLMCYLRVCPFTKPIGQDCTIEKRADQCCPIVTCPDVPVDLLTSTSTSSPAEYGATGLGKVDKYGCSINGKYFAEGSKVPPSPNKPCEHCYCIRNMTTCVMQECTLHVDGCTPIYHKDVCCPVRYSCDHPEDEVLLLDDMTTTVRPTPGFLLTTTTMTAVTQMTQDCVHDDQIFADGALIKTEKACEHCYCMKGDIVCVVQECGTPMENEGKNCTSLPPRQGQCCPDTYICEGDELSTEVSTGSAFDDLTTIVPPRRVEGSGYRLEPDEPYTEIPAFEGSGDEQTTTLDTSEISIPQKQTPELIDEVFAVTEESMHSSISTIEPDKSQNTVPDEPEEPSEPKPTIPQEADIVTQSTDIGDQNEAHDVGAISTVSDYYTSTRAADSISKEDELAITPQPTSQVDTETTENIKSQPEIEQGTTVFMNDIEKDATTQSYLEPSSSESSALQEESADRYTTLQTPEFTEKIDETSLIKETTTEFPRQDVEDEIIKDNKQDHEVTLTTNEVNAATLATTTADKIESPETTSVNPIENEIDEDISPIPSPGRIPGEGDCLLNGITYKNNTSVPNTNNCHSGCRCVSSIVKCDPIICSPPPENMDSLNDCQPIYDTPDACCPTYVCHSRETIPPESHNQMSGTESPKPSPEKPTIECHDDECKVQATVPVTSEICSSKNCVSETEGQVEKCKNGDCIEQTQPSSEESTSLHHPEGCIGDKCLPSEDSCSDGKCQQPTASEHICNNENGCQPSEAESCTGKNCEIGPEVTATKDESHICENGEECKVENGHEIPKPACDGDSGCDSVIPDKEGECTGAGCRRKEEEPQVGQQLPSECSSSGCTQEIATNAPNVAVTNEEELPKEPITEAALGDEKLQTVSTDKQDDNYTPDSLVTSSIETFTEQVIQDLSDGQSTKANEMVTEKQESSPEMFTEGLETSPEVFTEKQDTPSKLFTDSQESSPEVFTEKQETSYEGTTENQEISHEESTAKQETSHEESTEKQEITPEVFTEIHDMSPEVFTERQEYIPDKFTVKLEISTEVFTEKQEASPEVYTEKQAISSETSTENEGTSLVSNTEKIESSPEEFTEKQESSTEVFSEKDKTSPELFTEKQEASPDMFTVNPDNIIKDVSDTATEKLDSYTESPQKQDTKLNEIGTETYDEHKNKDHHSSPTVFELPTTEKVATESDKHPAEKYDTESPLTTQFEHETTDSPKENYTDEANFVTELTDLSPTASPVAEMSTNEPYDQDTRRASNEGDVTKPQELQTDSPALHITKSKETETPEEVYTEKHEIHTELPETQSTHLYDMISPVTTKVTPSITENKEPEYTETESGNVFTDSPVSHTTAYDKISPEKDEQFTVDYPSESINKASEGPETFTTEQAVYSKGPSHVDKTQTEEMSTEKLYDSITEKQNIPTESSNFFTGKEDFDTTPNIPEHVTHSEKEQELIQNVDEQISMESPDTELQKKPETSEEVEQEYTKIPETQETVTDKQVYTAPEEDRTGMRVTTSIDLETLGTESAVTDETPTSHTVEHDGVPIKELSDISTELPEILEEKQSSTDNPLDQPTTSQDITSEKVDQNKTPAESLETVTDGIEEASTKQPEGLTIEQTSEEDKKHTIAPEITDTVGEKSTSTPTSVELDSDKQTNIPVITLDSEQKISTLSDINTDYDKATTSLPEILSTRSEEIDIPSKDATDYLVTKEEHSELGTTEASKQPHIDDVHKTYTDSASIDEDKETTEAALIPVSEEEAPQQETVSVSINENYTPESPLHTTTVPLVSDYLPEKQETVLPKDEVTQRIDPEIVTDSHVVTQTDSSKYPVTPELEIQTKDTYETEAFTHAQDSDLEHVTETQTEKEIVITTAQAPTIEQDKEKTESPMSLVTEIGQTHSAPHDTQTSEEDMGSSNIDKTTETIPSFNSEEEKLVTGLSDSPNVEVDKSTEPSHYTEKDHILEKSSTVTFEYTTVKPLEILHEEKLSPDSAEQDKSTKSPEHPAPTTDYQEITTPQPYPVRAESETQIIDEQSGTASPIVTSTDKPFVTDEQETKQPDKSVTESSGMYDYDSSTQHIPTKEDITTGHPQDSAEFSSDETKLPESSEGITDNTRVTDAESLEQEQGSKVTTSLVQEEEHTQSPDVSTVKQPEFSESEEDKTTEEPKPTEEQTYTHLPVIPETEQGSTIISDHKEEDTDIPQVLNTEKEVTTQRYQDTTPLHESMADMSVSHLTTTDSISTIISVKEQDDTSTESVFVETKLPEQITSETPKESFNEESTTETSEKIFTDVQELGQKPSDTTEEIATSKPEVESTDFTVPATNAHPEYGYEGPISHTTESEVLLQTDTPSSHEDFDVPIVTGAVESHTTEYEQPNLLESVVTEKEETTTDSKTTDLEEHGTPTADSDDTLIEASPTKSSSQETSSQESETTVPTVQLSTDTEFPESHTKDESQNVPEEMPQTVEPKYPSSETTPYLVELEEHTNKIVEESSTIIPFKEYTTTRREMFEGERGDQPLEFTTDKTEQDIIVEVTTKEIFAEKDQKVPTSPQAETTEYPRVTGLDEEIPLKTEVTTEDVLPVASEVPVDTLPGTQIGEETVSTDTKDGSTLSPSTPGISSEQDKLTTPSLEIQTSTDKKELMSYTEKTQESEVTHETSAPGDELIPAITKATTISASAEITTALPEEHDKYTKPEDKPIEPYLPTASPELPKPGVGEMQPTEDISPPDFPPSGTSGYGQEPDYVEEDQAFGPGTCRYGGKVYVSAQQIPRDDPCDFCFCFRSDIICLQQSCPPPIHGCHEEPIQGFCCPRYECPVSMATTLNVTTTTTTTTTTLPPHFLPHAYKGAAQRRGCQIKGHTYKVGEVVRASSGPCLHCTCGGDGQMKCDPKACTPEPMLRQMIAAAVSAKRRR